MYCTTYALVSIVHDWVKATDDNSNKKHVHIVLLDFEKAFNLVDTNTLVGKLEALDIPDPLLRWTSR